MDKESNFSIKYLKRITEVIESTPEDQNEEKIAYSKDVKTNFKPEFTNEIALPLTQARKVWVFAFMEMINYKNYPIHSFTLSYSPF